MKDATTALRTKYVQLLNTLMYEGKNIPVYADEVNDTIPGFTRDTPPKYYFIVSNQNVAQTDTNKCGFNNLHSIQVDACSWYPAYQGSYVLSEKLNQLALDLIMPTVTFDIQPTGFKVYKTTCNSFALKEPTAVRNIFRRITIFNHSIKEI